VLYDTDKCAYLYTGTIGDEINPFIAYKNGGAAPKKEDVA
jgi:hypothetical protein